MASKFCIHYVRESGRPSSGHRTGKVPKKGSTKECANPHTIALIFLASKAKLKILHARLQHYTNQKLPMFKLGLEKEEELDFKLPTFAGL